MNQIILKVEGMNCNHCKAKVTNAVASVSGVEIAKVDLAKKEVVVTGCVEREALVKIIEDAGYTVA